MSFRSFHQWAIIRVSLAAGLLWACIVWSGCDSGVFPPELAEWLAEPNGASPASANPADDGSADPQPTPTDVRASLPPLSFEAAPGFCCNPLSIRFRVNWSDVPATAGVQYIWDFGDNRDGRGRSTNHVFDFPGTYDVSLEARLPDGTVQRALATLTLGTGTGESPQITLSPPQVSFGPGSDAAGGLPSLVVADAGPDLRVTAGQRVLLDGSRSLGLGTEPLHFQWAQTSGTSVALQNAEQSVAEFLALNEGSEETELTFTLAVTQGDVMAQDVVIVLVVPGRGQGGMTGTLRADAGDDRIVAGGSTVVLDGTASTWSGVAMPNFSWSQRSGPPVTLSHSDEALSSFVAPAAMGERIALVFRLTVSEAGESASDEVTLTVTNGDDPGIGGSQDPVLAAKLAALSPLSKTTYSSPIPSEMLKLPPDVVLLEYARITGAVTIDGVSVDGSHVRAAAEVCEAASARRAGASATLSVFYDPWFHRFGAVLPPTDTGPTHDAELALASERFRLIDEWLEEANRVSGGSVAVSAVLLDGRRFEVKPGDDSWNDAITEKLQQIVDIALEHFPVARIEWVEQGIRQWDVDDWGETSHYTYEQGASSFSCMLDRGPHILDQRETFRNTHALARVHGVTQVTPWVALASGRPTFAGGSFDVPGWTYDWEYDTEHSYHLGEELHDPAFAEEPELIAPWNAAAVIVLDPGPFDDRAPRWWNHFIAYVLGATGEPPPR